MDNSPCVVLPDHRCWLGEGPVWDAHSNRILWVDILQGDIHGYGIVTEKLATFNAGQMVGSITLRKKGGIVAAMQRGFFFIDPDNEKIQPIADPEADIPGNRFNDGKCDPHGRFWAGTMSLNDVPNAGSLYMLEEDGSVTCKIRGVSISNGLAWSIDHKTMYYIDTPTSLVMAYDYAVDTGNISNGRAVIHISEEPGSPDGMTIDTEGMLWIAHWDGWQVTRWDPHTGKLLLRIAMPVARVTSCTFGGDKMDDLYITSASDGLTEEELKNQPLAGSLFVIKSCGFRGIPPFEFGG